jgi:tetrahydromethanopterin S-methyltransferase subunit F
MTERGKRESLLLGVIAGAIIAIVIVVPLIALNL